MPTNITIRSELRRIFQMMENNHNEFWVKNGKFDTIEIPMRFKAMLQGRLIKYQKEKIPILILDLEDVLFDQDFKNELRSITLRVLNMNINSTFPKGETLIEISHASLANFYLEPK